MSGGRVLVYGMRIRGKCGVMVSGDGSKSDENTVFAQ
jgi:hypothetical protein